MSRFRIAILAICVLLAGCAGLNSPLPPDSAPSQPAAALPAVASAVASATPGPTVTPEMTPEPTPTPTPAPVQISIMAVGDLMFQYHAIQSAYNKETKSYDFNYSFQHVKDILESADLALGNFECTLGGPQYSQRKSLRFSVPDAAADALRQAGFDVLSTVNNHANDKGRDGILRTLQVLGDRGLECIGTRENAGDKPYIIRDVKGIKIGLTSYSFGTRPGGSDAALNGRRLSEDAKGLVNMFSNATVASDLEAMAGIVRQMRDDGAEIVAFYIHWGTEYQRNPNSIQKKMAKGLADAGVDIIFGGHPHWLQTVDVLTNEETGRKTVVAYSLGNFISNQRKRFETYFKYSEDCMILNVKVMKQHGGIAGVCAVEYLPTWTFMYVIKGKRYYTVVPLEKAIASPETYGMNTKGDLRDAKASLGNTQGLFAGAVSKGYLGLMELD